MKVIILMLATLAGSTLSQTVNNVFVRGHINYMRKILNEVAQDLERREWCNLKVPDVTSAINETVIDHHYEGSVTYSNGFVVGIRHLDILRERLDQNWSWNATDQTATVLIRGILRMTDVTLGYDVIAALQDSQHHYTVAMTVPLISFTFEIRKNVNTEEVQITVTGAITTRATINRVKFMPLDKTTDVLITLFNVQMSDAGILAWADDILEPLALEAYHNKVEFPSICYDCNLASVSDL